MRWGILGILLFTTSCGHFYPTGPSVIDPEIQPYYDLYIQHKLTYTGFDNASKVDIRFNILPGQYIGRCWKYSDGYRLIEIDSIYWAIASEKDKEVLLFHELGHCDLNRPHTDLLSIMETYHIGGYRFNLDEPYYLPELFQVFPQESFALVHTISYPNDNVYVKPSNAACDTQELH